MIRLIAVVLFLIGIASTTKLNAQDPEVTKEVEAILGKFDIKKWEIEKEANAKMAKLQDDMKMELGRLQEKLTKTNQIDDALYVRGILGRFERIRPLKVLFNPTTKDYLLAATDETIKEATAKGYAVQNIFAGFVFSEPSENTVPLMTLFHKHRDDFFNTATKEGLTTAQYEYDNLRIEGHIYPNRKPGTVPLYLYWNDKDNATLLDIADPEFFRQGYRKVRLEGWVLKADKI